jgi:hypothetical protein
MNDAKLGSIAFVRNSYGVDLSTQNGGMTAKNLEQLTMDITGTLTIAGGATSGVPVQFNPRSFIKSVEVRIAGSPLSDSFVEIPLKSLVAFNMICDKDLGNGGEPSLETPIASGEVGTYTFRGRYRLPFMQNDFANPYKFQFPESRYGQVSFRIKFGSEEDLVAGGDRTKTVSACSVVFYGRDNTGDPKFDLLTGLFFAQRVTTKPTDTRVQTANTDLEIEITRTNAYLHRIMIEQHTIDSNGVETPVDTIIRPTDPVQMRFNDKALKFEDTTWEYFRDLNATEYGKSLPFGLIVIDFSPRCDVDLLNQLMMANYQSIKVRLNNAGIANGSLRVSVQKLANQAI